MQERDLIGYGGNPPHAHWPGGARVALQFVLNVEIGRALGNAGHEFVRWPQANLAIVTGTVSALVVFDVGGEQVKAAALDQLLQGQGQRRRARRDHCMLG